MSWWWFPIGFIIGVNIGIIISGILRSNDDGSSEIKPEKRWWDDV